MPLKRIGVGAGLVGTHTGTHLTLGLQRALRARALYRGEISGVMDARTRAAVRRLQEPQGLDSGILSLAAARQLGLLVDPRFARPAG
jgi:peptidoglycan hydrolase-like protein with peptidoglycan-binding domain